MELQSRKRGRFTGGAAGIVQRPGQCNGNEQARRGYSRDSRGDGKPTEHQAILLYKLGMRLPRSLEAVAL